MSVTNVGEGLCNINYVGDIFEMLLAGLRYGWPIPSIQKVTNIPAPLRTAP